MINSFKIVGRYHSLFECDENHLILLLKIYIDEDKDNIRINYLEIDIFDKELIEKVKSFEEGKIMLVEGIITAEFRNKNEVHYLNNMLVARKIITKGN